MATHRVLDTPPEELPPHIQRGQFRPGATANLVAAARDMVRGGKHVFLPKPASPAAPPDVGTELRPLDVFNRESDEKPKDGAAVADLLRESYHDNWAQLVNPKSQATIVLLGAGDGGTEVPLLVEIVAARGSQDGLTIVWDDINPAMEPEFKRTLAEHGLSHLKYQPRIVPIEKWNSDNSEPGATLVLAPHAVYETRNFGTALERIASARAPGGVAIIVMQSYLSQQWLVRSMFRPLAIPGHVERCGEDATKLLKQLGIASETHLVPSTLRLGSVVRDGVVWPGAEGEVLLQFMLFKGIDNFPGVRATVECTLSALIAENDPSNPMLRLVDAVIAVPPAGGPQPGAEAPALA